MTRIIFSLLVLLTFDSAIAQKGKRIEIEKAADNGSMLVDGNFNYAPGDTIVVRSSLNPWSYFYFKGLTGTPSRPIVIINEGQVSLNKGFEILDCQYLKLLGNGGREKYGFLVEHSAQTALVVWGKSAHIEVSHFFVNEAQFGCWVKNEAKCDTSINNWVLNDISIHDFEMHRINIEGFYMGSTDPNNESRPIDCNGTQQHYKPSKLGNIKVYNGVIDGTGRPAILLCNASVGNSEIYNNVISNVGREYNEQQGTGISIGTYTRAYIHHNKVKNTYTWGIASLGGSGLVRIENNQVDSSGYLDGKTVDWPQNILVDTRRTIPMDSTTFIIRNNKLSHPGRKADYIFVGKTFDSYTKANVICNNSGSATIKVAPGITWSNCGVVKTEAPVTSKKQILWMVIGGLGLAIIAFLVYFIAKKKRQPIHRGFARQV